MRRLSLLTPLSGLFSLLAGAALAQNSAPVVSNVVAQQIAGTGDVRITYDVSDADSDSLSASIICSSDNGVSFNLMPVTVSGDIHRPMQPGPGKQIIWNASADYPGRYWSQVVAKVVVSDGPVQAGEMIYIAAGPFTMGNNTNSTPEEKPERVVILDAYYIDKFEVSNAEFQSFIDAGGYTTQAFWSANGWNWRTSSSIVGPKNWGDPALNSGPGYPGFPVIGVSYYEAEAYANFAGKRLPSEAEWEKAARGPDTRIFPWGSVNDCLRANSHWNCGSPYYGKSSPLGYYDGSLHPTPAFQTQDGQGPYGTFDQAGNALEWVRDWYSSSYYSTGPSSNPQGPGTGSLRVMRGGGYSPDNYTGAYQTDVRCTRRFSAYWDNGSYPTLPHARSMLLGFRCARSTP